MKILHVSASDSLGGAARAAARIHLSLCEYGDQYSLLSQMRVLHSSGEIPFVEAGFPAETRSFYSRLRPRLSRFPYAAFRSHNPEWHSAAWPDTGLGAIINRSDADVVHLHWVGRFDATDVLSIEEIGRLRQPIVWTLHDQWAFCGAEHYTLPPVAADSASRDERYVDGYTKANRPSGEGGPDLNRRTWLRKGRAWRRPMQIVCPSQWLAQCASRSALMRHWPISVIANPVDLQIWSPADQRQARALLRLPLDRPLVVFGAMGGTADPRKGADLLFEALRWLRHQVGDSSLHDIELVVFGQRRPAQPPSLGFPIHYTGHLQDDLSLRLLYAAADVFVIPSRQDNLPNTGLEAQACGTPVVAFRTGGLPDIVEDRVTGALADPFRPESLADALRWILQDPQRRLQLAAAARARAERLWSPGTIARLYAGVYSQAGRPAS